MFLKLEKSKKNKFYDNFKVENNYYNKSSYLLFHVTSIIIIIIIS